MKAATVLVTDGDERAALAITRSLGRAGHAVLVASARGRSLAGASRFCRAEVALPPGRDSPAAYVEAVRETCAARGVELLIPVTDRANLLLLPVGTGLAPTRVLGPAMPVFQRISDKGDVAREACRAGLRVPAQRALSRAEAAEDPDALTSSLPGFPIIVKPSRSVTVGAPGVKHRVVEAVDAPALRAVLGRLPDTAFPVLLQEKVRGSGMGVFLLRWEGRTVARFAHRRLREKPPAGGVSVYRESVVLAPALAERCERLLEAYEWNGVAMVELKLDRESGEPYLMEVNGRFWGSLQLAIDAGVDFPRLLVEAALDRPAGRPPEYRVGVRTRWWWGDVDHYLARARGSGLDSEDERISWARALRELLAFHRGDRFEVLRPADPRPFVRESVDWLRALARPG